MNPVEPSAELRQAAHSLREMYLALIAEGFTVEEAMNIIAIAMSAGQK